MNPFSHSSKNMKTQFRPFLRAWPVVAGALSLSGFVNAGDDPTFNYNRFNVGVRFFFNISADIQNNAVAAATGPVYDDGFLDEDSGGPLLPTTWNWGYHGNNNQLNPSAAPTNLELHSTTSPRDGRTGNFSDDPEWGFDLSYGRVLGRFDFLGGKAAWGVEGGFSSTDIEMRGTDDVSGTVMRQTYQFPLTVGVLYPSAPYAGSFNGPGTLVGQTPVLPAPVPVVATSSQRTQIDGLFYGFRAGGFLEVPLFSRFSLGLGGGGAVVHAEADVTIEERFSLTLPAGETGGPPATRVSKDSGSDWLFGAYGEVKLNFELSDSTTVFLGGQYQLLDDFDITAGSKRVSLKLSEAFAATAGLSFRF